jgi:phospholipase/lecithinase/hemolysin
VGYLTTAYNKSPFLTYNFGYSGAVVDKSIVNNNGHDIHEQVYENFLPRYKRDKTFHSSTSLFAFWIGINDLMHADLSKWSSITDRIFKSYGKDIEALYKAGARNIVLLTLPPLQYAPRITNQKDEKRMRAVADAVAHWNSQVKALQKRIEKSYSKTTVFVFDTYPLFLQVIEKPSAFKETSIYKNTDNYCKAYAK